MFTLFFLGISGFQLVFIAYQYLLLRRIEFVYYFFYSLLITIFIIGNLLPQFNPFSFSKTNENIFIIGRGIILVAYAMYFHFGRQFTDLPKKDSSFNRFVIYVANIILVTGIIDLFLQVAGVSYLQSDKIIRWIFFSIIFVAVYIVFYLIKKRQTLTTIFVIGSLLLVVGASIGLIDLLFFSSHLSTPSNFIIYLEVGIICEFLFLTYGLVYKTKVINEENITLIKTQYQQIIDERKRIITDLHDDVGATLSSMHIYGDLAASVWDTQPQESKKMVDKISDTSKELMGRMGDIIWSMNSANEERFTLEARLKNYCSELLTPKNISCQCDIDTKLSAAVINPEIEKTCCLSPRKQLIIVPNTAAQKRYRYYLRSRQMKCYFQ